MRRTPLRHPPQCLGDDRPVHLGCADLALDEGYGHFLNGESALPGAPREVDLEAVPLGCDGIKIKGAQHIGSEGAKATGCIRERYAESQSRIHIASARQDFA